MLKGLKAQGVKVLALRCSGTNNVDLKVAQSLGLEKSEISINKSLFWYTEATIENQQERWYKHDTYKTWYTYNTYNMEEYTYKTWYIYNMVGSKFLLFLQASL